MSVLHVDGVPVRLVRNGGVALDAVVAGAPVTYEYRDRRWYAVAGHFGLITFSAPTYVDVRDTVLAHYGVHDRQSDAA